MTILNRLTFLYPLSLLFCFELVILTSQILTIMIWGIINPSMLRILWHSKLRILSILNFQVPNWLLIPSLTKTFPLSFCHFSTGDSISSVAQAKNLGVILDSLVSLTPYIWSNSQSCELYFQNIANIWSHVQDELTMKCSFISLCPYKTIFNNLRIY